MGCGCLVNSVVFGLVLVCGCYGWVGLWLLRLVGGFVIMALMSLRFWVSVCVLIGGFSGWCGMFSGVG